MTDRKLGQQKDYRERTLRNLATSLVLYEKIETTQARAKAVLPLVERLIHGALKPSLVSRRYAKSLLFDSNAVAKLFTDLPARQGARSSGFIRLTKLAPRAGDRASMVQMELLFLPLEVVVTKTKKKAVAMPKSTSDEK